MRISKANSLKYILINNSAFVKNGEGILERVKSYS